MGEEQGGSPVGSDDFAYADEFPFLEPLFHEQSVLELDSYLAAFKSLGDKYRFSILYLLHNRGELSAKKLEKLLDRRGNGLHYHLEKLTKAGLIENKRRETTEEGERSFYRVSLFGDTVANKVFEIIRSEKSVLDQYSSVEIASDEMDDRLQSSISDLLASNSIENERIALSTLVSLAEVNPRALQPFLTQLVDLLRSEDFQIKVDAAIALRSVAEEYPEALPNRTTTVLLNTYRSLLDTDQTDEAIEFSSIGHDIYEELNDREGIAKTLVIRGWLALHSSEPNDSDAETYLRNSREFFQELNDREGEARALLYLGIAISNQGRHGEAQECFSTVLDLAEQEDDLELQVGSQYFVALSLFFMDQDSEAIEKLTDTIELATEAERELHKAKSLQYRGIIKRRQDDIEEAIDDLEQAQELFAEMEYPARLVSVLNELGLAAGQCGDDQAAQSYFEQSLEIHETSDLDADLSTPLYNLGIALRKQGEVERALEYFERTVTATEKDRAAYFDSFRNLVQLNLNLENADVAEEWCEHALEVIGESESDFPSEERRFRMWLAELRDSPESMRNLYESGLTQIIEGERNTALSLLGEIWNRYERVSESAEVQSIVLSAGVGVAALLEVIDVEEAEDAGNEIIKEISEFEPELTGPGRLLYQYLSQSEPRPERIHEPPREEMRGGERLEAEAYDTLLQELREDETAVDDESETDFHDQETERREEMLTAPA